MAYKMRHIMKLPTIKKVLSLYFNLSLAYDIYLFSMSSLA
jgi:hypothetical protein